MKTLPETLESHLAGQATTMCSAWRLTRRDGVVLGFTDHDRPLAFDGTVFSAVSGFAASDVESALGLSVDSGEVAGAFSSVAVTEAALREGRFDGARVELFAVNWARPEDHVPMRVFTLGEVVSAGEAFRAELRGLAAALDEPGGRICSRRCDADLGDERCQVDLWAAAYRGMGTVAAAEGRDGVRASGLGGFADGWFRHGLITWTGGANAGLSVQVLDHSTDGDEVRLSFWTPVANVPEPGDAFTVERGGAIAFRSRTRRAAAPLAVTALADEADRPLLEAVRAQANELVREAVLDHFDAAADYEPAAARSRRIEAAGDRLERLSLPVTMGEEAALKEIDLWLRDHWAGRESVRFAVSPAVIGIEPGDVVTVPGYTERRYLVTRIDDGAERRVEARQWTGGVAAVRAPVPATGGRPPLAGAGWAPVVHILDLPVIEGADETAWARAAACSRPWRAFSLWSSTNGENGERRVDLTVPARIGELTAPLGAGMPGRFDRTGDIGCKLYFGAVSSASTLDVLNGANVLAVKSASGAWEVLQFAEAEEVAPGEWRLTELLRGQAGTEDAALAGAAAGAPVVVLDAAVAQLGLRRGEAGLAFDWEARRGNEVRPVAEDVAAGLRALMPLSPVHLKARRLSGGAIRIEWTRRGRFDADSWLGTDIPLDVASERYRVEILDGETPVRVAEVAAPAFDYDGEAADFGGPVASLTVEVRQFGERVALGLPARATLAV